jgi:hypothetical protein
MKTLLNILGILLTTIGTIYIISYLNLLTIGYNFTYYVYFIIRRIECLIVLLGISILIINNKGD